MYKSIEETDPKNETPKGSRVNQDMFSMLVQEGKNSMDEVPNGERHQSGVDSQLASKTNEDKELGQTKTKSEEIALLYQDMKNINYETSGHTLIIKVTTKTGKIVYFLI
jgi:hypothetical protein